MPLTEENGIRKLAAIMFTDIKGFSKKMGENEVAAMQILHTHDTMMKAVVAKYGGIVIKSIGDSFMVDFSSAVNAVKCAIEAQENFWNHNKDKSEFDKIEIRVGVHLGDVITVGNDIYGDGVNIAARIEAITEPTRICISQDVYNQVKKKMQIRVYNIGSLELKNIDEPVEVFEILLDSIPELSEPSQSALQSPTRKKADAITKQEEEEARHVEVAKKKAEEERQKEEEEKQRKAQEVYQRAEAYFQEGNIDKAEAELKEVYKIVSMHYGAQMLTLQIEEARTKREEEERRQRIKEEKKRKEEERKQHIQEYLQQALRHVEQEQFADALAAAQKVYAIDPNNAEAKKLEEQIRQAEQAKAELDQLQAAEAERRAQEEALRQRQAAAEELAKARAVEEKPRAKARQAQSNLKLYIGIGTAIVVLAVGIFFASSYFAKPPSFAVFPLQQGSLQGAGNHIGTAFSSMLADGLARGTHTTVISTSSTGTVDPNTASVFDVRYAIQGTVQVSDNRLTAHVKLLEVKDQQTVWESNFDTDVSTMHEVAAQAAKAILNQLNIESLPLAVPPASIQTQANELYYYGVALIHQPNIGSIEQGIIVLQQSLAIDSTFALGHAALGEGLLLHYKRSGEKDTELLNDVFKSCGLALGFNKNIALAYQVLGEAYRLRQQFDRSRDAVAKSLSLQPGNADCYRQLVMLSLIEGDVEKAGEYVTTATKLDPLSHESYFVKGLVHHYKREFAPAVQAYENASLTGAQDSLLTVNYKFSAWIGIDADDKIISYCNQLMSRASDETNLGLTYRIAQAQQSSGGKQLESLDKLKEDIAAGKVFLDQNPTNATATAYLALMYARKGEFELAQKGMETAISLDPKSPQLLYLQARAFAIQNEKAKALETLSKAVAIEYNFAEILDPDFASIAKDPEFAATIARKSKTQATTSN